MAKETTSAPSESTNRRGARPVAAGGAGRGRGGSRSEGEARSSASLLTFFEESRAELRKVTWPTREEATNLTIAVIAMTVAIAAFLGLIDGILGYVVKPILGS